MYKQPRNLMAFSGVALALMALGAPAHADTTNPSLTDVRQEVQIATTYALNPYLRPLLQRQHTQLEGPHRLRQPRKMHPSSAWVSESMFPGTAINAVHWQGGAVAQHPGAQDPRALPAASCRLTSSLK